MVSIDLMVMIVAALCFPPRVNNGMVNVTYKGIWLRMHIFFFYRDILIGTAITEPK